MGKVLTRNWQLVPWLAATATVFACGGKALDIGFDQERSGSSLGGTSGAGTAQGGTVPALSAEELAQVQWPADVPCEAAPESRYVGVWKGHWPDENGFASRDAVLTITGLTPDGTPCGTLRVGEGEALEPATDPDQIYPTTLQPKNGPGPTSSGGTSFGPGHSVDAPWPGYEYTLLNVIATEQRLAFGIAYNDILQGWCALQTQAPNSPTCLPEFSEARPSTNGDPQSCQIAGYGTPPTDVPCFKIDYCNGRCFCYEGSCTATPGANLQLELHWDGAALEGSINSSLLIFLDPVAP